MENSSTVFVFPDAEHARIFNQKVGTSSDAPQEIAGDIEILPFSINPPPGDEPSMEETVSRFDHYEYTSIIKGIDFLLRDNGIDVLNLSLGPAGFRFDPDDPLQVATRHAYQAGVPVVVAVGNDGPADGTLQPLAQAPWVIAVGATDSRRALLETSSRGRPEGPFPTVVTFGHPEVRYIGEGIPEFGPGTSFATSQVARIALLLVKAMELLLGNWNDAGTMNWTEESRPIRLSTFGLADTGIHPRTLGPLPAPVASVVAAHKNHLTFSRTEQEHRWLATVRNRVEGRISLRTNVDPELVREALRTIAEPLPGRERHEAGFGFVSRPLAYKFLTTMTPSRLLRLLCPDQCDGWDDLDLSQLDNALGPLWCNAFVDQLQECFHFGMLLKVAKVA